MQPENQMEALFGLGPLLISLPPRPLESGLHLPSYREKSLWSMVLLIPLGHGVEKGREARGHVEQDIAHFISATQAFVLRRAFFLPRKEHLEHSSK